MAYDLKDASIDKPLKEFKPRTEFRDEIPEYVSATAGFLCSQISKRPKRPKRPGGFQPRKQKQP